MPETIQRSFTGGEIASSLRSRADLNKYATGLALCQNFIIRSQGGVYSRPGTRFIGEVSNSTKRARLIPFSFNTEQTYILVFEEFKIRVMRDGGYVLSGGSPYEVVSPYSEVELKRLVFTQSADVMTIVHPSHDPRDLSRTADDAWSLDVIDFTPTIDPPSFAAVTTASITNITQANPAVVTAIAHGFTTGDLVEINDVGGMIEVNNSTYQVTVLSVDLFRLDLVNSTGFTAYTSGGTASIAIPVAIGSGASTFPKRYSYVVTSVDENGVESIPSVSVSLTTDALSTTAGIRLTWLPVVGADYYRVYKDPSNNTNVFGWIGNSENVVFDDYNVAPLTSDAPPRAREPFSGVDNKPSTVNYYQQRQIFANTMNERQTVYTTQTSNSKSLRTSIPARDDDAITLSISSREVNEIRHIIELDAMILLTSGGEWRVTEGQDQVLTPSTVGFRKQSSNGASWVTPVTVNDTVIFVQEKGARIRDMNYEVANDRFRGNDLSIMAEHLFEGYEILEMAHAAEPYGVLWLVRDDGVLLGLTYQRDHQVWAWHTHITNGEFESVATISEDGRDATYCLVKRIINGSTVRYVERFEKRDVSSSENVFCVDSGLTYDGPPITVITGADHLEGEEVAIVADGNVVTGLTVTGGSVTLPRSASKVVLGKSFLPVIETLDVDIPSTSESLKSQSISISKVTVEVEKSRGGWVGPKNEDGTVSQFYEIKPRFETDGYDTISLRTWKEEITLDPQWGRGGGIRIEQRSPLPMAILSITPEVNIG